MKLKTILFIINGLFIILLGLFFYNNDLINNSDKQEKKEATTNVYSGFKSFLSEKYDDENKIKKYMKDFYKKEERTIKHHVEENNCEKIRKKELKDNGRWRRRSFQRLKKETRNYTGNIFNVVYGNKTYNYNNFYNKFNFTAYNNIETKKEYLQFLKDQILQDKKSFKNYLKKIKEKAISQEPYNYYELLFSIHNKPKCIPKYIKAIEEKEKSFGKLNNYKHGYFSNFINKILSNDKIFKSIIKELVNKLKQQSPKYKNGVAYSFMLNKLHKGFIENKNINYNKAKMYYYRSKKNFKFNFNDFQKTALNNLNFTKELFIKIYVKNKTNIKKNIEDHIKRELKNSNKPYFTDNFLICEILGDYLINNKNKYRKVYNKLKNN